MTEKAAELRPLSERIKSVHDDVRTLRAESAPTLADVRRLRGKVVGMRADITRIEMRIDAFAERVNDRFDQLNDWLKSDLRRLESQLVHA